ncbi:shikimate dehydrogenase [Mumia sp. zg.B17]|uniref:shikimate dehydrogenase n=1 Tax=unclassified Mumia TaxID=2621872 RepID=UPI001C6E24CB|nr:MULTISPECIES: shikimate dehydrogenase [unclassified Mumia]MBW9206051.1 shikimate dehydrogenase [Mumia sp. zg.B17]MDD9348409.1 shikimate dehydrogenase [Mumia sp.]
MPRCAVLGSPISHSLSPVMHRAAYAELGLSDWSYDALEVDEDGIGPFLSGLDEAWRGLSLTMPLKRAVIPYLDTVHETGREVGGVNTVIIDVEGRHGFNTDVSGGTAALRERGVHEVEDALVIGAGATAESMVASLRRLGLRRVTLAVRSLDRGALLAERITSAAGGEDAIAVEVVGMGADLARSAEVVVSTVPADAVAPFAQMLAMRCDAVLDVVYDPWPTPLARAAHAEAVPIVSGLDLLAHQGAEQVRLMTGHEVSAVLLRDAALAALSACR